MRTRRAIVAALAGVLALAGCRASDTDTGGSGGQAAATTTTRATSEVLAAAGAKTLAAGSARVAMKVVATGGRAGAVDGTGVIDFKASRGQVDMTISGVGPATAIFDQGVVYQKSELLKSVTGGKTWLKIDLSSLTGSGGAGAQVSPFNPSQALNYLQGVSGEVQDLGSDTVRGQPARHYKATIDLEKAAAKLPPEGQALVRQSIELGGKEVPTELWVDQQGRLTKLVQVTDYTKTAAGKKTGLTSATTTVEYYDFGVPASVTIPPAADVATFG